MIAWVDAPAAHLAAGAPAWLVRLSTLLTVTGQGATSLIPLGLAVLVLALTARLSPSHAPVCRRWLGPCCFIFLAVALSGLAVDVLKVLAGRPRPYMLLRDGAWWPQPLSHLFPLKSAWQSWPSGHANTLMALALAVGAVWPRYAAPALLLACVLATTRVWLAMHYPADVAAGFAIAALTTPPLHRAFQRRGWLPPPVLL